MKKNINNMLEDKKSDYNKIEKDLEVLEKQLYILSIVLMEFDVKHNVEYSLKYDIEIIWNDYKYMNACILYNIKRYIESIMKCLNYINSSEVKEVNTYISLPYNLSVEIASSIETVFYSFNKIIEQPFPDELRDMVNKKVAKKYFPLKEIQRNKIDGLYWRFNIFRNRSVHPNSPKYYNDNIEKISYKFISFNAIAEIVSIRDNIKLYSNIVDIKKNPYMYEIIQREIINKENINRRNILDIIFPDKSPKYKKNILISSPFGKDFKAFDYINDFLDLYNDMSSYIKKINCIFLDNYIITNKPDLDMKFKYLDGTIFSILEVF